MPLCMSKYFLNLLHVFGCYCNIGLGYHFVQAWKGPRCNSFRWHMLQSNLLLIDRLLVSLLTNTPHQMPWPTTPSESCENVLSLLNLISSPYGFPPLTPQLVTRQWPVPRARSTVLKRTPRHPKMISTTPTIIACRLLKGLSCTVPTTYGCDTPVTTVVCCCAGCISASDNAHNFQCIAFYFFQ